jgi:hypothetical protein
MGEQRDFTSELRQAFLGLTSGLSKTMVVWSFAYDQGAAAPFDSMGLISADGTQKQAWTAWMEGR